MEHVRKLAVIAVTEKGANLSSLISSEADFDLYLPDELADKYSAVPYSALKDCFKYLMNNYAGIVAVMAQGIVTRMIAPNLKSKYTDPAIVTCDEVGRFAISTVSGHEGGANKLAHMVASITGAIPVITTATEANKHFIIGIGCRKNTDKNEIINAVEHACELAGITACDLRLAASAWVKKDEQGLLEAMDELKLYIRFLPERSYKNHLYQFTEYEAPMKHFGIAGVAEPSALISAVNPHLVLPRKVIGNVTCAIVKEMINE